MTFSAVLDRLKNDPSVRIAREEWCVSDCGTWIELTGYMAGKPVIRFGGGAEYHPSTADLYADDWGIIEDGHFIFDPEGGKYEPYT